MLKGTFTNKWKGSAEVGENLFISTEHHVLALQCNVYEIDLFQCVFCLPVAVYLCSLDLIIWISVLNLVHYEKSVIGKEVITVRLFIRLI